VAREGSGGFIGAALVAIQGVGNARGSNSGDVTGRGRERSGNGGDDRWVPPVGEEGSELGYRFGFEENGPRAGFLLWAGRFPQGPNRLLFPFLLFLFLEYLI
jgi:hypothetical protein